MAGRVPGRIGTLHPNIAPYGEVFACACDKPVVLAIGSDRQFASLCRVLKLEELPTDERFARNTARVKHRTALQDLLSPAFAARDREALLEDFRREAVPAGAIRALDEVFAQPEAKSRLLTQPEEDGSVSTRVASVAFRLEPLGHPGL
jgi:crotonobetainyl-CoA:carnitine CoA-transferase CaiB-like acyl-CoA transferase